MPGDFPRTRTVGDSAILVEFEEAISSEVNLKVRRLAYALEQKVFPGVQEVVLAYRSLMVYFDPCATDPRELKTFVAELSAAEIALPQPRLFKLPTVYGGVHGPDLERVARLRQLTTDEVVRLFSSAAYPIYFLGFLCALAYLGGVSGRLNVPRLDSPRPVVPAGSVGTANRQANVNPVDLPSGFNYLGRTFVRIYNPERFPPTMLEPGDYLQFIPCSEKDAEEAAGKEMQDFLAGYPGH
jgi:inhibitor of KinA